MGVQWNWPRKVLFGCFGVQWIGTMFCKCRWQWHDDCASEETRVISSRLGQSQESLPVGRVWPAELLHTPNAHPNHPLVFLIAFNVLHCRDLRRCAANVRKAKQEARAGGVKFCFDRLDPISFFLHLGDASWPSFGFPRLLALILMVDSG